MDETTLEQDRIEHNLERARSRMDARLTELQEKLSPGQVLDDLMAYFRGSEGAEFGRNLVDSVKNNPLPAALTGIGLTWLMAANRSPDASTNGKVTSTGYGSAGAWRTVDELDRHLRSAEEGVVRRAEDDDIAHRGRVDEARAKVVGITREADESAESFGKRVRDAIGAARESFTQAAQGLSDKAGELKDKATRAVSQATSPVSGIAQSTGEHLSSGAEAVQQMGSNLFATMNDNPILLGAVGLTVGALLGSLVPQSEAEETALSRVAGTVRETATDLAQQVVDRGSEAAQQLVEGAQDSAQRLGLSGDMSITDVVKKAGSGELLGNIKDVALDGLKAGEDAVRQGGGSPETASASSSASPQPGGPAHAGGRPQTSGASPSGSMQPSANAPPPAQPPKTPGH